MAELPALTDPITSAIDAAYVAVARNGDSLGINMSSVGNPCDRALWFDLRWASLPEEPTGKRQRIFKSGEIYERRLLDDLRSIGCDVLEIDEATGAQLRVELANGFLRGKVDGRASNVPGGMNEHIVECKSHGDKSFKELIKKGLREGKPEHFAQIQLYMHGTAHMDGLYIAANKNTDEIYTERVRYDPSYCAAIVARVERIVEANRPPPKNESHACKFCRHKAVCQEGEFARVNCRTCLFASPQDGGLWTCEKHAQLRSYAEQQAACADHLYVPDLVPGDQLDADEDAGTVTYRLSDGSTWIDGASAQSGER